MKSCFFIGHRETSTEILPTLTEAVERHIAEFLSKHVNTLIGDRTCGPLIAATGGGFYRLDNASPLL